MVTPMDIRTLPTDALVEAVNRYPWYGAARMELCIRLGGGAAQYADAALYLPDRAGLSAALRAPSRPDCSDPDLDQLLRPSRRVVVVGGDYFSQAEYDRVREGGAYDFSFGRSAAARPEETVPEPPSDIDGRFCTEALARIFAEQGYPAEARHIYSRLRLLYPEKSAYFASLIEKLDLKEE